MGETDRPLAKFTVCRVVSGLAAFSRTLVMTRPSNIASGTRRLP